MADLFDINIDTEDDVLAIRRQAVKMLKDGKTLMSWTSGGGASFTKQFTLPVRFVMEETKKFLQAYDPDTYGRRITRTRPDFRFSV